MTGRVTDILEELRRGNPGARDDLFRLVHAELRRVAGAQLRRQRSDHTLQPTALVHEAYLKLMGASEPGWNDRAHFFRAAAQAMRAVLVDFARRRSARKRGGDSPAPVTFDEETHGFPDRRFEVLAVHEALDRLEQVDPKLGQVVALRFFAGLSVVETGRVMSISERSVYVLWEHARAWLYREIAS